MQTISPFLWFDGQAEEAAEFYVSVFPNSSVVSLSRYPENSAFPAGTALGITFILDGLELQALNAGPQYQFTEAISLFVKAETQREIDRLWERLTSDGGEPGQCGWLKDRYGLSWQVVPPILGQLLGDTDSDKAERTMHAMMTMGKIDIAELQAAYDGG